jgi:mannose-6-phosphate isomerase-like protein (cupin superfamily)
LGADLSTVDSGIAVKEGANMRPTRLLLLTASLFASVTLAQAEHSPSTSAPTPPSLPKPLVLQENDGEHLVRRAGPTGGWPYVIKLDAAQGNTEDFFVMAEVMAPGQSIPFHKHENAEEILILEEGGATVVVGDQKAVAGPRTIVYIPRNTWISAKNTSDHDIHLIAVFSRLGFDQYMRAISAKPGEPLTPLTQDDLTRLRAMGHATYWDPAQGPAPPGVPTP